MRIVKVKDYQEMSRKVANLISAQITLNPSSILGLATGSTPEGAYKILARRYKKGDLDFSEVVSFNLDEYVGLSGEHPQSYRYFMNKNLFDLVNIDLDYTYVPRGTASDPDEMCDDYEAELESYGYVDLQILGLGRNGHIGFNEPSDHFSEKTYCVDLTESTIEANARLFDSADEVPRQAYTMGIGTIMHAGIIVLAASGKEKAQALHDALEGPITPACPASILQMHEDVIVVADEDALSLCTL